MTDDVTPLFTDLVLEVFQFNGRLLAVGDRLSAPVGLTSARWQILGALDAGPLPVSGIARTMGLTRQSVQRTVDVLMCEGLVESRPNPEHKRAYLVALSADGRRALDRVSALQRDWAAVVAEGIAPHDLSRALEVLRTLRSRLEAGEGEGP